MLKSSSTNCVHAESISCTGKHNHESVWTPYEGNPAAEHILCVGAGTQSVCGIPHNSIMHLASGQCEKSSWHRWTLTGHRLALHWPGTNWPYTDPTLLSPVCSPMEAPHPESTCDVRANQLWGRQSGVLTPHLPLAPHHCIYRNWFSNTHNVVHCHTVLSKQFSM